MIYLDNNATTKPFIEVVEVMTHLMLSRFWNASSAYGQVDGLEEVVTSAKAAIRKLLKADANDEVVFTSGATESNAWAVAEGVRCIPERGWVLTSQIEHPSVTEAFEGLTGDGIEVRYLSVTKDGVFDLQELREVADADLHFASLMFAHNETGVIQPLLEAASIIRQVAPHCLIHTDATQAIAKIPVEFAALSEVDLASFSGHKFGGPKGIGGLVIKNGVQLKPMIKGGGQQNNLRSGTLNIPAIAGLAEAANKSSYFLESTQYSSVALVRDYFEQKLRAAFDGAFVVGSKSLRLPNTSFFGLNGTDADDIVQALAADGIILSKGSSCSAESVRPSRTALLMGLSFAEAASLLRFSASPTTTMAEVDVLINKLNELYFP